MILKEFEEFVKKDKRLLNEWNIVKNITNSIIDIPIYDRFGIIAASLIKIVEEYTNSGKEVEHPLMVATLAAIRIICLSEDDLALSMPRDRTINEIDPNQEMIFENEFKFEDPL